MNALSPIDAAFVRMESPRTPMHIGGLLTFRLPAGAPDDFLQMLLARMRSRPLLPSPLYDCRLSRISLRHPLPSWQKTVVDVDYHIRHSALPWPGGERELGVLVARLHSHPLDLSRPPWEVHLIEGLEGGRFALYLKTHHSAVDGIAAMRIVRGWLSEDRADMDGPGLPAKRPEPDSTMPSPSLKARVQQPLRAMGQQLHALRELAGTLLQMSQPGQDGGVRAAMATPSSLFNVPISQHRRLGTQLLDLARIRAIAEHSGATVNDVSIALCGGAIRRYLQELDALPKKSLQASVPVGLARSDGKSGNAVAGFVCPMGTQQADPARRLHTVTEVTTRAKQQLRELSPAALQQFTLLGMSPLILGQMSGTLSHLPPFFNVTVSNVVVSRTPLYLCGAELEAIYPMSILFDGYALNITLVGYHDRVAVGFTGCREAVPSLQRLAVYTGEEVARLEQALGVTAKKPGTTRKPAAAKTSRGTRSKRARPDTGRKTGTTTETSPARRKTSRH